MGRVKLQIKRLENVVNRQVTFSKRRNGLIKKVFELSVLCDVDVALVMFSPAGRLSLFSGNKSIEDILTRYVNLPRHERGRPGSGDSEHVKEIQQEILKCKSQMEEVKNRLRIFEGDLSKITTLPEVEMHEQILEETLNRLHMCQVHLPPSVDDLLVSLGSCTTQPTYLDPQVEILNFLSANGLLPLSDDQVLQPTTTVTPNKFESGNNNSRSVLPQVQQQHLEIKQGTNVNLLQWNQLYPTGDNVSFPPSQQRADDMFELFNPPRQL